MVNPQDAIFIKGDTINLQFQLYRDKSTNEYWDLTCHQIRFQLNTSPKIYKATANVSGGGDDQVSLVDAKKGIFLITITHEESSNITPGDYTYEIQITTPNNQRYTILQSSLRILNELIEWENIP